MTILLILTLTPSLLVLAIGLWRAPINQENYMNAETSNPVGVLVGQSSGPAARNCTCHKAMSVTMPRHLSENSKKYENGKNRVSASRLQEFADILDVSAPYLFPEDRRPLPPPRSADVTGLGP